MDRCHPAAQPSSLNSTVSTIRCHLPVESPFPAAVGEGTKRRHARPGPQCAGAAFGGQKMGNSEKLAASGELAFALQNELVRLVQFTSCS